MRSTSELREIQSELLISAVSSAAVGIFKIIQLMNNRGANRCQKWCTINTNFGKKVPKIPNYFQKNTKLEPKIPNQYYSFQYLKNLRYLELQGLFMSNYDNQVRKTYKLNSSSKKVRFQNGLKQSHSLITTIIHVKSCKKSYCASVLNRSRTVLFGNSNKATVMTRLKSHFNGSINIDTSKIYKIKTRHKK